MRREQYYNGRGTSKPLSHGMTSSCQEGISLTCSLCQTGKGGEAMAQMDASFRATIRESTALKENGTRAGTQSNVVTTEYVVLSMGLAAGELLDCHSVFQVPLTPTQNTQRVSFTIRPPYVVYHLFLFFVCDSPFELRATVTGGSC